MLLAFCTSMLHLQNIQAIENHPVGHLRECLPDVAHLLQSGKPDFFPWHTLSDSPQAVLLPSLKLLR